VCEHACVCACVCNNKVVGVSQSVIECAGVIGRDDTFGGVEGVPRRSAPHTHSPEILPY
jgi:hypothetical protein